LSATICVLIPTTKLWWPISASTNWTACRRVSKCRQEGTFASPPNGRADMRDHSHRFLFLAATGLMCATTILGSQFGPSLLLPDNRSAAPYAAAGVVGTQPGNALIQTVNLSTPGSRSPGGESVVNKANPSGTASVVPNRNSCPAADAATLLSPPTANGAIGSPPPVEQNAAPITDAELGTGSSCPANHSQRETAVKTVSPSPLSPSAQAIHRDPHSQTHP
jgi:hypothetical protein